jgi:hypothetical protein
MGQAVVDAPDPLQNPKPATPPSADDMLSQLAGDEIDRLLAEAEGQKSAKGAVPTPASIAAAPEVESVGFDSKQSAAEIDALLAQKESDSPPVTAPAEPAAVAVPVTPPAEAPAAAAPEAPVTTVAPAAVVETPKPEPVPAAVEIAKEIEQNEEERKALRGPEVKVDAPVPQLIFDQTAPLPLVLKPFEWLSSPLDACPEIVREAIGKIAIVTMVNAIAVLSYVLIFHRHH